MAPSDANGHAGTRLGERDDARTRRDEPAETPGATRPRTSPGRPTSASCGGSIRTPSADSTTRCGARSCSSSRTGSAAIGAVRWRAGWPWSGSAPRWSRPRRCSRTGGRRCSRTGRRARRAGPGGTAGLRHRVGEPGDPHREPSGPDARGDGHDGGRAAPRRGRGELGRPRRGFAALPGARSGDRGAHRGPFPRGHAGPGGRARSGAGARGPAPQPDPARARRARGRRSRDRARRAAPRRRLPALQRRPPRHARRSGAARDRAARRDAGFAGGRADRGRERRGRDRQRDLHAGRPPGDGRRRAPPQSQPLPRLDAGGAARASRALRPGDAAFAVGDADDRDA